jgi:hypothetical protein
MLLKIRIDRPRLYPAAQVEDETFNVRGRLPMGETHDYPTVLALAALALGMTAVTNSPAL